MKPSATFEPEPAQTAKPTPTATQWVPMTVKEGQTKIIIFVGFGTGRSAEQQAAHQKLQVMTAYCLAADNQYVVGQ